MSSWSQRLPTILRQAFLLKSLLLHEREMSQRCTTTNGVSVRTARCRRGLCWEARMEQRSDQRTYQSRTLLGRRDNMQWRRRLVYRTSLDVSGTVTITTAATDAQTPERSLTRRSSRGIGKGRLCALAACHLNYRITAVCSTQIVFHA